MKECTVCKQNKPLDAYYNRAASEDGKAYRCKKCDDTAVSAYRKRHEARFRTNARKAALKFKYGITPEDYNDMLISQNYKCLVCQEEADITSKIHTKLVVDHCHTTKEVRGLLCAKCNKALGLFKDSTEILQRAIDYLSKSEIH